MSDFVRAGAILFIPMFFSCDFRVTAPRETRPVVIAHRGASYDAPEHTLAAYDLALEQGADYIEQDIGRTRDGVLVVLHDATLDRTLRGDPARCTGSIVDRTLAEIRTCDAGSWFNEAFPARAKSAFSALRVSTLSEVLERYGSTTRYYIEIKDPSLYPGIEADLLSLLSARSLGGRNTRGLPDVFIHSFSEQSLERIRALNQSIPLVLLVGADGAATLRQRLPKIAAYAAGIAPRGDLVNAGLSEAAHANCLVVHAYTVDEPQRIQSLLATGVDGIFTNRPDVARAAVETFGAAGSQVCRR